MPHFGELQSILGTLRRDGPTSKRDNSLVTDDTGLTDENGLSLLDQLFAELTD